MRDRAARSAAPVAGALPSLRRDVPADKRSKARGAFSFYQSVFIRVHPVELLPLFHRVNPWLKQCFQLGFDCFVPCALLCGKTVSAFSFLQPVKCAWPVEFVAACEVPGYFTGLFRQAILYFTGPLLRFEPCFLGCCAVLKAPRVMRVFRGSPVCRFNSSSHSR